MAGRVAAAAALALTTVALATAATAQRDTIQPRHGDRTGKVAFVGLVVRDTDRKRHNAVEHRNNEYPDREEGLPDNFARLLFRMSSLLPARLQAAAQAEGFLVTHASRGFVFNADLVAVVRFLEIGTQVAVTAR